MVGSVGLVILVPLVVFVEVVVVVVLLGLLRLRMLLWLWWHEPPMMRIRLAKKIVLQTATSSSFVMSNKLVVVCVVHMGVVFCRDTLSGRMLKKIVEKTNRFAGMWPHQEVGSTEGNRAPLITSISAVTSGASTASILSARLTHDGLLFLAPFGGSQQGSFHFHARSTGRS